MKSALVCTFLLLGLAACTPQQRTPDQIRQETANATHEAAQDAKAMAKGVVEGLKEKGPININKASADDLKTLPGIDDAAARRIIDDRPYADSSELAKRHVISRAEYDRIAGKVTAR